MHQGYYWLAPGPLSEMTAGKNGIPPAELDIITDMLADMLLDCAGREEKIFRKLSKIR